MSDSNRPSKTKLDHLIDGIIRDVCELPDYNSPDDQPELLQATCSELEAILRNRLAGETDEGLDAARYRFLRQPGNAIVYAKDRNAWGKNASGHVAYDTAEQLDAAVDAARGDEKAPDDLNLEPIAKCDYCGRKVWKSESIGKIDEMTQPDGSQCGGRFVPL